MPTRNINLTDHYDGFLAKQLTAGVFKNASEVVRAGLRLLEQQTAEGAAKIEALRDAHSVGLAAYESGEFTAINSDQELDQFFDDIAADS